MVARNWRKGKRKHHASYSVRDEPGARQETVHASTSLTLVWSLNDSPDCQCSGTEQRQAREGHICLPCNLSHTTCRPETHVLHRACHAWCPVQIIVLCERGLSRLGASQSQPCLYTLPGPGWLRTCSARGLSSWEWMCRARRATHAALRYTQLTLRRRQSPGSCVQKLPVWRPFQSGGSLPGF
jgi:hypothetical protein